MGTACKIIQTSQTFQRRRVALVIIVGILATFWALSRYPDLIVEYIRASNQQLLDRDVGVLSKDAMLATHNVKANYELFLAAAVDWFDTNKIGMTFGFFFSAALLLLLEQSVLLRQRGVKSGFQGILSGILLGMPLGVCSNCATPVGLGLKKSGVSDDASFATLIASPCFNPIGLAMIFYLFPMNIVFLRLALILAFLFLILPLLTRAFGIIKAPLFNVSQPIETDISTETWQQSASYCFNRYRYYLTYIFKQVFPLMFVMGLIGALLLVIYPLQSFLLGDTTSAFNIILAGIVGTLLPVPMFVDLVLVYMFYQLGLPLSIVITLLLTMAPTSAFSLLVMGRHVGWRLSLSIGVAIAALGIGSGFIVQYQQVNTGVANEKSNTFEPFKVTQVVKAKKPFDFITFDSFLGAGVSIIDHNNNGLSDIFLPGDHGARLYSNKGNMKFIDETKNSGINGSLNSMAGIWGDYDNDGLADLYLVNYRDANNKPQSNLLYKNLGGGRFKDVTKSMDLTALDYSSSAAWADFDNDGDLDLFVGNYGKIWVDKGSAIHGESQADRLYRNDGDKFTDITKQAGVGGVTSKTKALLEIDNKMLVANRGFSFQPVWFDFNNDNLIDLYISQDFGSGQLYQNKGDGTFSNVTKKMGLNIYGTGMGVTVTDFNQDGFWDLFVSTGNSNQLWINQKGKGYLDQAEHFKMDDKNRFGWGIAPIDIDNSAHQSYFVINGATAKGSQLSYYQKVIMQVNNEDKLFVNGQDNSYKSMDKKYRLYSDKIGRGLAVGDLNNDGHMDMVVSNRDDDAQMIVYKNNTDNKANHFLKIKLKGGKGINDMAVGTRVSVYVNGKAQHQLLSAGSSFLSQSSPILSFGLGEVTIVDKVIVTWPNGKQRKLVAIPADKVLEVSY